MNPGSVFESSDEKDVINVHSLPWRSKSKRSRDYIYASNCDWSNIYNRIELIPKCVGQRADDMRSKIKHHAADRKPRLHSEPAAESIPPQNSPKWTISKEWKKGRIIVIMQN